MSLAPKKMNRNEAAATEKPTKKNKVEDNDINAVIEKETGRQDKQVKDNKVESQHRGPSQPSPTASTTITTMGMTTEERPTIPAATQEQRSGLNETEANRDFVLQSSGLDKPRCPKRFDAIYVSKSKKITYVFDKNYEYSLGGWLGYKGLATYTRNKFLFTFVDAAYRRVSDGKLILFSGQL